MSTPSTRCLDDAIDSAFDPGAIELAMLMHIANNPEKSPASTEEPGTARDIRGSEAGLDLVPAPGWLKQDAETVLPGLPLPSDHAPDLVEALRTQYMITVMTDPQLTVELVNALAVRTLVFRRSERWCEAVSTALLGTWSDPLWSDGHLPTTAIGALKAEARTVHRQLVPVWERRTRHGRVLSLDADLGGGLSLHDLVRGRRRPAGPHSGRGVRERAAQHRPARPRPG